MSAAKIRQSLPSKLYTHYLCIPLVTQSSKPQFYASSLDFARYAKTTVVNPDVAMLYLGQVKLESKERIDACLKHLHDLNLQEMLQAAAVSTTESHKNNSERFVKRPLELATQTHESPLRVDVSGICMPFIYSSSTKAIGASAFDRTHRLEHFHHKIIDSLWEANFLPFGISNRVNVMIDVFPSYWTWKFRYSKDTGLWNTVGQPKDPAVTENYYTWGRNDFVWAKNVRLERLCVIPKDLIKSFSDSRAREKQMEEVDGIMLP